MWKRKNSSSTSDEGQLSCPSCGLGHGHGERFCDRCGMPLVYLSQGAEEPAGPARERARKIRPEFTEGELVRVAGARHQAEAELIQGLLLEEGVPSMLRRSAGFDVPDFLAAGPRDVLVPAAGAEAAREVLLQAELAPAATAGRERQDPGRTLRLAVAIAGGGALTALVAWALVRLAT